MATQHRDLPRFGVQFHPECILTPEGPRIVESSSSWSDPLRHRTAGSRGERAAVARDPARVLVDGDERSRGDPLELVQKAYVQRGSTVPWKYQSLPLSATIRP